MVYSAAIVLASAAGALADNSLHVQPPGRTGGFTSDSSAADDSGHLFGALAADRFALQAASPICGINWWGFYGGNSPLIDPDPPLEEVFQIKIYGDAAGLPASPLFDSGPIIAVRAPTGMTVALSPRRREYIYRTELTECFGASAGINYWLSVNQVGDAESRWRWEGSNTSGELAIQSTIGSSWQLIAGVGQLAYELRTPEPATGALLALGIACRLRRRSR